MTRGDVYRVRLPARRGHEHGGARYAVVVQADELLRLSTVLVAPTSRSALPASFRPEIEVAGEPTRVLVEQLRALDLQRLDEIGRHLGQDEMRRVDDAIEVVLGLR